MEMALAISNNSKAQYYVGSCYQNGFCYESGKGTDKDETKAFEWYLKSAISGYTKGQRSLGYCYLQYMV
ncbi:hypothetical protein C1645_832051 [Glomus cerebriforme]|uniref:Uncharacterized protein n=1 Tax=Glomus cerebriforme TaxID=658196 RepID=A0A397SED4_9GLOM|nr:hypothetical protein C1645_832051 [Glomus cerebriforme]